jgi:hypothetical protein
MCALSKGDFEVSNLFRRLSALCVFSTVLVLSASCIDLSSGSKDAGKEAAQSKAPVAPPGPSKPLVRTEPPPRELLQPVDLWKNGQKSGRIDAQGPEASADYVFMDLGDAWAPILFTDGEGPKGEPYPHNYRPTYLALARGEFPDDVHGERAREDKYLELYGIMPTLSVLQKRIRWAHELECKNALDLTAINNFHGVVSYEGPTESMTTRDRYLVARKWVEKFMAEQGVTDPAAINPELLKPVEQGHLRYFLKEHDDFEAIKAAQDRLACEGYFKGKGKWTKGAFDWATHEALAEFERRHRVYSWGALGADTLEALRMDTELVEYETVIRVLTERAMHAFGAIEDGTTDKADGTKATYTGMDGKLHEVPNLEAELRAAVIEAFGLKDPGAASAFLDHLPAEAFAQDGHYYVAIPGPRRPEYHSADMDIVVSIDRGDVWYEFLYDESGVEKPQPVSKRPYTSIYVNYNGQKIPLAKYGTTIGGWRSELIENAVYWKYKDSPPGDVLWEEIVSAPVWLPPLSTPPRDLLKRREKRKPEEPKFEVNYHETGPSYASAYGLVAAYHRPYVKKSDGTVRVTGDEGIRSHGSVDYMSIMRRHSHGCHRLHNHIAVRLFSFVINHRPHHREGHQPTNWWLNFEYEEQPYSVVIKQGGYVFKLEKPIFVTVEEGRIRGSVEKPLEVAIPKFITECNGYYLPDGSAVTPHANGTMEPRPDAPPCASITPPAVEPGSDLNAALDPSGAPVPAPTVDPATGLPVFSPTAEPVPAPAPAPSTPTPPQTAVLPTNAATP